MAPAPGSDATAVRGLVTLWCMTKRAAVPTPPGEVGGALTVVTNADLVDAHLRLQTIEEEIDRVLCHFKGRSILRYTEEVDYWLDLRNLCKLSA